MLPNGSESITPVPTLPEHIQMHAEGERNRSHDEIVTAVAREDDDTEALSCSLASDKYTDFPTPTTLPFIDQLSVPGTTRLASHAFPVPDIAELVSALTDEGEPADSNSVDFARHPQAQRFQKWVQWNFHKNSNIVLLDLEEGSANITQLDSYKSRYNDLYIMYAMQYALDLVTKVDGDKKATVGVFTAYKAQYLRYLSVLATMELDRVGRVKPITVRTFDNSKTEKFDFIIMDILALEGLGRVGSLRDPRRMSGVIKRAKNGLVVITTLKWVYQTGNRAPVTQKLVSHMSRHGCRFPVRQTSDYVVFPYHDSSTFANTW